MADVKVSLVLGAYAHVPYGADSSEFEHAYNFQLRPFVSGLYKYPRIQAALHYSGVLLHWVERSHPELFMLIGDMVARKQVEMLGGGFYEPMLPIIPLQDKIGQIELLTTYLRKQFGKRPQGCWIPAFAWEQGLVSPLAACGMGFTFLNERQFTLAGAPAYTPCICEDQGKLITVFPVLQSMETILAEKGIGPMLASLREHCAEKHSELRAPVVSVFPGRINTGPDESIDSAWNRFFEELSLCENFVEVLSPGKLARNLRNLPKLYFPDSAGCADGMSSRRFIIAHPEAGRIYSKMIFTNVLINQLRGDKSRKLSAHEELWKAQGSALFCATGRQGLHNHLLRNAAYSALLAAERITREKGKFSPSLLPYDFNMDGKEEWLFQEARINCYVQSKGGGIFELDYLPKTWNYLNSCGGRLAFTDRLLPAKIKAENLGHDIIDGERCCAEESYEPEKLDKVRRKLTLILRPSAPAKSLPFGNIEIAKSYMIKKDTVCAGYVMSNRGTAQETFKFAPGIDLALPGEDSTFVRFFTCKANQGDTPLSPLLLHGADGLKIHDIKNEVQITLSSNRPFDGAVLPLHFHDNTGEKLYQAYCVMPLIPVSLGPGESCDIEFTLRFSH
jgi:hypothetical protein